MATALMFSSDYWLESPTCLLLFLSGHPNLEFLTTYGTGLGGGLAQLITSHIQ